MARTPQEVFEHHGAALTAGDIDGIGDLPSAAWDDGLMQVQTVRYTLVAKD